MSCVLFCFATDFSLILLIKGGALSGTDSYQSLVNKTFGFPGYLLLSALQFMYPFIGKVAVKTDATIAGTHMVLSE